MAISAAAAIRNGGIEISAIIINENSQWHHQLARRISVSAIMAA